MSDINIFNDPNKVPKPKQDIKIENIQAIPYADLHRVKAVINITPFLERPNLLLMLRDETDNVVSELNIIETMHADMEFTIHIRQGSNPGDSFILDVELFYETRMPPQDQATYTFRMPE